MQIHGSCAARDGAGVIVTGPPGSGKSDLVLRLIDRGFELVADDRVDVAFGLARAPAGLAGLIEVRGLGIMRFPCRPEAQLALVVNLVGRGARLPRPARCPSLNLPWVALDPAQPSAPQRVELALDCALGRSLQVAGAFTL